MSRQDFDHQNAQAFELDGGDDSVLLIHGFSGSPSHMRPLGEYLAGRGFRVRGLLLPGHNLTLEDMIKSGWKEWLNTATNAAREMRKSSRRFYAAGLSMGGVLSMLIAEEGLCDAVAPLAAPVRIYNWLAPLSAFIWPVMPYSPWKKLTMHKLLDNEYDFGYEASPVRKVPDLRYLMRTAERNLAKVTCPVLAVQSRRDETVRPVSAQMIVDGVSSLKKKVLWLDKSSHVLTIGPETNIVFPAVADWFLEAGA